MATSQTCQRCPHSSPALANTKSAHSASFHGLKGTGFMDPKSVRLFTCLPHVRGLCLLEVSLLCYLPGTIQCGLASVSTSGWPVGALQLHESVLLISCINVFHVRTSPEVQPTALSQIPKLLSCFIRDELVMRERTS